MQKVLLSEYFEIKSSLQDDKINFEISDLNHIESIPFLGRSSSNNGVVDYVSSRPGKINDGGVLTIALDGSTGSTFYQHHPFSSGQNIWLLIPKEGKLDKLTPLVAMFLVTTIKKAVQNYSYNLSLTKTRLMKIKILLPILEGGRIDIAEIAHQMKNIRNSDMLSTISKNRKSAGKPSI